MNLTVVYLSAYTEYNIKHAKEIWMYGWCISGDWKQQQLSFSLVTYGDEHSTSKKHIAPKITPDSICRTNFFSLTRHMYVHMRLSSISLSLSLFLSFSLSLSLSLSLSVSLMKRLIPGRWSLYTRRRLSSNSD